jgi:hypothetical protein
MNKYTHKTIRVNATVEFDLTMNINVPIDTEEGDIRQAIYDDLLYDTPLSDWEEDSGNSWKWQDHDYDMEFSLAARDFSKEILKQLEEPE